MRQSTMPIWVVPVSGSGEIDRPTGVHTHTHTHTSDNALDCGHAYSLLCVHVMSTHAQDDDCGWELDLAKACKWSKDDCCPSKPRKHKGLWSKLKSGAKSLFTKDEPAPYWQADRLPLKIYRSAAPEQAPAAPARKKEDKGALAKAKAFFTCSAFL